MEIGRSSDNLRSSLYSNDNQEARFAIVSFRNVSKNNIPKMNRDVCRNAVHVLTAQIVDSIYQSSSQSMREKSITMQLSLICPADIVCTHYLPGLSSQSDLE